MGQQMLNLLPLPNGVIDQAAGQQGPRTTRRTRTPHAQAPQLHHAHRRGAERESAVQRRASMFDRDDSIALQQRRARRRRRINNVFPGDLVSGTKTQGAQQLDGQRDERRLLAQPLRLPWSGPASSTWRITQPYYRSNFRFDPPRLEPFGAYRRPAAEPHQTDEYPVHARTCLYGGGNRSNLRPAWRPWCPVTPSGNGPADLERELPLHVPERPVVDQGAATTSSSASSPNATPRPSPARPTTPACTTSGTTPTTRSARATAIANALLGVFTTYTELTNRIDRERRHWQTDVYAQDSWRMTPRMTLDYGVRVDAPRGDATKSGT